VIFEFSDRISVFDKRIPSVVPRKGEVICGLAAFWFALCAERGIRTHFLGRLSPTELLVKRVEIERDYAKITADRRSVLVPCEFIVRHYVAGSFLDRFKGRGTHTDSGSHRRSARRAPRSSARTASSTVTKPWPSAS
jgi:phosphoribosylaminoimidazole-succinocarboxamide synthase